jgi:DGQHR domain-containing protein
MRLLTIREEAREMKAMTATTSTEQARKKTVSVPAHHGGKLYAGANARELKVTAVPIQQHGRTHYMVTLKAKTVHGLITAGLLKVDKWSESNDDGYQREPTESRVKKFARFAQRPDGHSPLTVMLYCRDPEQIDVELQDGTVELTIRVSPEHPIYIPDGQHRLYGLMRAIEMDPDFEYEIGAVLMVAHPGIDPRFEEATQFFTINSLQKRVPVDLAQRFLLRKAEAATGDITRDSKMPMDANREGLTPYAVAIVDMLNADPGSPWNDQIDPPNVSGSTRPIKQNAFVESILPLLKRAASYGWTVGRVVDTISAFWQAVFDACPKAAEHWHGDGCTDDDHEYYVLRTTSGVYSLNDVLDWMQGQVEVMQNPTSPDSYSVLFEKAEEHFRDIYWLGGDEANGAGMKGTSRGAFKDIAKDIQAEIASNQ